MRMFLVVLGLFGSISTVAVGLPVNQPPPAGPVVLDLNGTTIPHGYQFYSVSFIASSATTNISFAFREDPAFLHLDSVDVHPFFGGSNLIVNGDFELGVVGSPAPVGWTYLNFGATSGGQVQAGCGNPGNCYRDGSDQAYDVITQAIATAIAAQYTIAFQLWDDGPLTTFSRLSTNGNTTDTGGNGANLLVYAGALPTAADGNTPLPAALPLFATGLGALGLLTWRRKRKNAAA